MNTVIINSEQFERLIGEIHELRRQVQSLQGRLGEPLYTIDDAARELNFNRRTISRMIADGRLNPVNKDGHPRFTFDELNRAKRKL